jgi:hypothetical protein
LNLGKPIFRAWYYFRTGYATYIAFILGFVQAIIIIYSLSIKPAIESGGSVGSFLGQIFPHLTNFAIVAILIGTPICIYLGLLHMKRTGAFAADASVSTESNPYVYRVVPGKEQEVFLPLWILTTQWLAKLLEQQNTMSKEDKEMFSHVLAKANGLLTGEPIGLPEKQGLLSLGLRKKAES